MNDDNEPKRWVIVICGLDGKFHSLHPTSYGNEADAEMAKAEHQCGLSDQIYLVDWVYVGD